MKVFSCVLLVLVMKVSWLFPLYSWGEGKKRLVSCYTFVVERSELKFAKDYPYPLNLRTNLVSRFEEKMIQNGDLSKPRSDFLRRLPRDPIMKIQRRLGLRETGCITKELVELYLKD